MAPPTGESGDGVLRLYFACRLKLEFHAFKVTSDAGLLPYRELDDAVGLIEISGDMLTGHPRGKSGRHGLAGQFSQSVFGRLGLQSGHLHAYACVAEGGGALVVDHTAGKTGGDQGQSCPPCRCVTL